ncbi:VOC family protein [Nocardia rosealba]|uniref:VOC family protein n=1 Tax=Nocardia rosealba TaxID=2878563 RepID=UPI001CD93540|nr:VOC family protein [Nocardia rosealba]MCA2207133.1 VOC family protein [Nocardia rosealba]
MPTRDEPWPQGTPCWVDCQVDDPAAARTFYSALFGWDIQDAGGGGYLMAMLDGRPAAGIGPKPDAMRQMPSVWTTYFAAERADEIAERVTKAGGEVFVPPFDVLDVGRMFVAADPTGGAFGVWEAKRHIGAGVFNQHGAYCWNELHTPGYDQAHEFYNSVFGWNYTEIGDGVNFTYSTFSLPGDKHEVGGMMDASSFGNPPYWLTWIQVDDADGALNKATELGAKVIMGPDDSPFGRMGILAAPQGEVLGVIDPAKAVGEVPTGA